MIDFELGDVIFWASIDGGAPFPVNVFRKKGVWTSKVHKKLTEEQRTEVNAFVQERLQEMYQEWKPHMKKRLKWEKPA